MDRRAESDEIDAILLGLTLVQRNALLAACGEDGEIYISHLKTGRSLMGKGLLVGAETSPRLTSLGQAVRQRLMDGPAAA